MPRIKQTIPKKQPKATSNIPRKVRVPQSEEFSLPEQPVEKISVEEKSVYEKFLDTKYSKKSPPQPSKTRDWKPSDLLDLYNKGNSYKRIEQITGINDSTVGNWLRQCEGFKPRSLSQAQRLVSEKDPEMCKARAEKIARKIRAVGMEG